MINIYIYIYTAAATAVNANGAVKNLNLTDSGAGAATTSPPSVSAVNNMLAEGSFGTFFLERGAALSAIARLRTGLQVQIVGDSRVLIDCLLGDAGTAQPNIKRFLKLAHAALETLTNIFFVKAPDSEEIAQQVPRKHNSAADAAANFALDNGAFMDVRMNAVTAFVTELGQPQQQQHNVGLLFSFDGAARGNPGPSSSGVCAWWGKFIDGKFQSKGLLIQRGTCLGTGTNNSSEAHGLASALKTCLHYHCVVIEQLSHLTQHTMSDEYEFEQRH